MINQIIYQRLGILSLSIFLILNISCTKTVKLTCGFSEDTKMAINHLQPYIEAMEKYKQDNGRYPKEPWKELPPKYLDSIPILSCVDTETGILPIHNVLRNKNLCDSPGIISEDGQSFTRRFTTNDERICLLGGRNNICEYTSKTKQWSCYSH